MSRVQGPYSTINPDRVNPQFIGIGQKYSEHKRNRMESDRHKKDVESSFLFTMKLDQQLNKNITEKQKQLQRLRAARLRHRSDIKHKLEEEERKERQLSELKQRSKHQRMTIKNGIKSVKDQLKNQRLANKLATKLQLKDKNQQLKVQNQTFFNQKWAKHKSVQISKKIGYERVSEFHRQRNLESYKQYIRRIQDQDHKSMQNVESIKKMQTSMKKMQRKINKKQNKLKQILDEINIYASQTAYDRKAKFLATTSAFRFNQTASSWRSKPTQILMTSFHREHKEPKIDETI